MQEKTETFKIDYYINLIFKHRWLIIVSFCLALIVGIYLALTLPMLENILGRALKSSPSSRLYPPRLTDFRKMIRPGYELKILLRNLSFLSPPARWSEPLKA